MKESKGISRVFAALGVILAAAALVLCLVGRNAPARMLIASPGASGCAREMFARLSAGDYSGASGYLYGTPELDPGKERESETGRQIWDAFISSIEYELVGDCYATSGGIAQNVHVRNLQISSVTEHLKERAQSLLEQRVAAAESMEDVYTEDREYREEFVMAVLRDAAAQAIAEDGTYADRELTLNMVYDRNQWWIVPDQALLNAISGGILGNA